MNIEYEQLESDGEVLRYLARTDGLDEPLVIGVEKSRLDGLTDTEAVEVLEAGIERTVARDLRTSDVPDMPASGELRINGETTSTNQSFNHTFESSGDHEVTITVEDNDSAVANASLNVTVQTPEEAVVSLKDDVKYLSLSTGTEKSLLSKLEAAKKSLERGNDQPAVNQLRAFNNHVEAQKGKKIEKLDAESLTRDSRRIISSVRDEPRESDKKKP